ncbi:MAG: hypothetical protein M1827_005619 [Pycnora praestabilis]|nr:MAG: hypothetical protein M1827_005619 [Pycnora praestabilis]
MARSINSFFSNLFLLAITIIATSTATPTPVSPSLFERGGITQTLSGAEVTIAPGTYPRANRLADGSIIGSYTKFFNNDIIVTTIRSTDSGNTWQALGDVAQGPSDAHDIDNSYPLQLPSGRILVVYRNHSKDPVSSAYTFFRITISYSDDGGKTWAWLADPSSDPGPVNGNWEPILRNADCGCLQLYYSRENSAQDQDTLERESSDGGATWSTANTISGTDITSRDGMTGVATVSGSTVIAVFECEQNGLFVVDAITSTDDGVTWGDRRNVYTPTGTNNNAGSPQVINVGGTLVVSFMTDEDTQLHDWTSGANAKTVTSGDGGQTWGDKTIVGQQQANWPGLFDMGDGTNFLALYDRNGVKVQPVSLS